MADLTAKEIASILDVEPKTFRRFVRSYVKGVGGTVGEDTPGRGGRYAFNEDEVPAIVDAFKAWRSKAGTMRISFAPINDEDAADSDAE